MAMGLVARSVPTIPLRPERIRQETTGGYQLGYQWRSDRPVVTVCSLVEVSERPGGLPRLQRDDSVAVGR